MLTLEDSINFYPGTTFPLTADPHNDAEEASEERSFFTQTQNIDGKKKKKNKKKKKKKESMASNDVKPGPAQLMQQNNFISPPPISPPQVPLLELVQQEQ